MIHAERSLDLTGRGGWTRLHVVTQLWQSLTRGRDCPATVAEPAGPIDIGGEGGRNFL